MARINPCLRACGVPFDVRKTNPYLGYETYDWDVPIAEGGDTYARYLVRMEEMRQSLRIMRQALDRMPAGPVVANDRKETPPPRAEMKSSLEALIHHFKLYTEGYHVHHGETYTAVAAPTAGLHFTPRLLAALAARGIESAFVTLHVGAGTFLPVKVADIREHRMHAEEGAIGPEAAAAINAARKAGGRIVAVGTTSLRLLETAADADGRVRAMTGATDLFIRPGYRFKAADLLLTNFHLPRSTLFMLACAFAGTARLKRAYAHAIEAGYRFYSYGDCCLLHRGDAP